MSLLGRDYIFERIYERFPKAARKFMKRIPVHLLLEQGAEKSFGNNQYELVIMINVLEHCFDALKVLTNLVKATRNGGLVVFSDKIFDVNVLSDGLSRVYDAAHPLRVSSKLIDEIFKEFRVLFKKEIEDNETSKYFPGTKTLVLVLEKVN
jgi:2-polyprenyl-3-methyl-5-hydroxy-6-metoxy-1,4-benzoquinol methylase